MKTILIPTDFSANATHAAEYALKLAKKMKSKLCLCNAFVVPVEMVATDVSIWPSEEYAAVDDESTCQLKLLKERLENKNDDDAGFQPPIKYINKMGSLITVIDDVLATEDVQLIVMGTHDSNLLSRFLLRNNCRDMIDHTGCPLLLVPPLASISPIKRIAFATDFQHLETDLKSIYSLIAVARLLQAEILIAHVYDKHQHNPEYQKWAESFLTDISNKANYPKIYYRTIENADAESGLGWLCKNGQVDMLAMVHHKRDFVENLLKGSHTQKMAGRIQIPLLVLPAHSS